MSAPSESSAPNPLRSVAWVCALLLCLALGALVYLSVDRRYLAAAAKTAKRERDQLLATQQLAGGDRSADDAKLRRLQASLTRLRNQLQTQRTLAARKQESLRLLWSKGTRLAAFTRAGAIGGQASLLIDGGLRHGVVQITGLRLPSGQLPSLWLKRGADYTLVSRLISNGFSRWRAGFRLPLVLQQTDALVLAAGAAPTTVLKQTVTRPGRVLFSLTGLRSGATPSVKP